MMVAMSGLISLIWHAVVGLIRSRSAVPIANSILVTRAHESADDGRDERLIQFDLARLGRPDPISIGCPYRKLKR